MSRSVDGAVVGGNAAAADAEASSSGCSSSSGSSSLDPERASHAKRSIFPPRRPGFQRLGFHEMSELRELRRAAQRASAARTLTTADASSQTTELPGLGAGPQAGNVDVRQFDWHMNLLFKGVLIATAIFCAVALFIYSASAAWIRIHYHHLFNGSSRAEYADHAGLPLFSGCESTAYKMYMNATESSLYHSQNPCEIFYRFVSDGWKHQHRLLSVVDAAENTMHARALSTIGWAPRDKPDATQSVASIVEKRVVELGRSCIEFSDNSLDRLKVFMVEHHLPWPMAFPWDPLEILLDLSENWNQHLWLRLSFDLTSRNVTGCPVLKCGHSAACRTRIASMRTFAGQPRGTAQSLRYQQYVGSMLQLFGVPESQAAGLAATIDAMNLLTLTALGSAMTEPEQRILRMSIRNLTETMILGIGTGRLVLLLNEHFRSVLVVRVQGDDSLWNLFANVLPEPAPGEGFVNWRNSMSAQWRLQKHDLTNLLKPGFGLRHPWSVHGTLTVSHDFVFPLYHPNLPPSVNYGGAGRLICVFQDPLLNKSSSRRLLKPPMANRNESPSDQSPSEWSPHHVDAKALMAALGGYRLGILRHPSDPSLKESSLARDRSFFVASCYALCSSGDYVDEMCGDASRRCNGPFMTLSKFSAAFQREIQNRKH